MNSGMGKKGHIVVTVKDLEKSYSWYSEVLGFLGFKTVYRDEKQIYFGAESFSMYVAIFQGNKEFDEDTFNRYRIGLHHIALAVEDKKTVDMFYEFLVEKKVTVTEMPKHYPEYDDEIYYAVFFNDPNGLRLEVFYEKNQD
jgi:catechol 2,3-dioxygenase-like lactoylglutathione lyase family enzyme